MSVFRISRLPRAVRQVETRGARFMFPVLIWWLRCRYDIGQDQFRRGWHVRTISFAAELRGFKHTHGVQLRLDWGWWPLKGCGVVEGASARYGRPVK